VNDKIKHPRAAALLVAKEICAALKPLTEKLIVAGSLRRRKTEVSDVEICYVGKIEPRPDPGDLLGQIIPTNLADEWIEQQYRTGRLTKRLNKNGSPAWGPHNKLAVHVASGIPVDFFQPAPVGWWSLVVCRTGSAAHNETVCNAAIARGERWNPYLGFEDRRDGRLLYVPRSEPAVFEHVRLPWREPWER
jgi:DNA polymerase/3'-5' exonuclease PolX